MTEIAIGIETATEITMAIADLRRVGLILNHAVKSMRKGIHCGQFARP
jgi:hypothetical protein